VKVGLLELAKKLTSLQGEGWDQPRLQDNGLQLPTVALLATDFHRMRRAAVTSPRSTSARKSPPN